jgi:hypothetical protein
MKIEEKKASKRANEFGLWLIWNREISGWLRIHSKHQVSEYERSRERKRTSDNQNPHLENHALKAWDGD